MTTEWIRIILSLALLCLTVESARYRVQPSARFPTGRPDFPESLVSQRYKLPPTYDQPAKLSENYEEFDRPVQPPNYRRSQDLIRDSTRRNGRVPYGGNLPPRRLENAVPPTNLYSNSDNDLASTESRNDSPSGYARYPRISHISERFRGSDGYGIGRARTDGVNGNRGNIYGVPTRGRISENKNPRWTFPMEPRPETYDDSIGMYRKLERSMVQQRPKIAESAYPKNVQVVYRADVEPSAREDYQHRIPASTVGQERRYSRINCPTEKPGPKRVPYLARLLMRLTEEAKKNNLRDLYELNQLRCANNDDSDEEQPDDDESSNVRDSRNTEEPIDRREQKEFHSEKSSRTDEEPKMRSNRKTSTGDDNLNQEIKNKVRNEQNTDETSDIDSVQSKKTDRNAGVQMKKQDRKKCETSQPTVTNERTANTKDVVSYSSKKKEAKSSRTDTQEKSGILTNLTKKFLESSSTNVNSDLMADSMEIPPTDDAKEESCSGATETSTDEAEHSE